MQLKYLIKIPKKKSIKEIKKYFKDNDLEILIDSNKLNKIKKDMRFEKKIYKPDLQDLYRLHQLIILNKRINVLEYGTGWSTLVILHALKLNEIKLKNQARFLRFKKKFSLTVVNNEKKYNTISKKRINNFFNNKKINVDFCFSENLMTTHNGRICSYFRKHPTVNPDFIYIDGPDQFKIKGKINNLTIANYEMMPMNSDPLTYENFLTPGTIILFDGRTANARFLKNNFQRDWRYYHDEKNDQFLLYLDERPLGNINRMQIKFYKEKL